MSRLEKLLLLRKSPLLKYKSHILKCPKVNFTSSKLNFAEYKTMLNLWDELKKTLNVNFPYSAEHKPSENVSKHLPKSQSELPVRKMKDSFDSAIVPLSTNPNLRDKYTTFMGTVRWGRLMEDVDLFAGYIAFKHILVPNPSGFSSPPVIVTVSVSDIAFARIIETTQDIRLSGHVCWVGTSSLEVVVWLDQEKDGKWERIMKALLLMAARNSANSGPELVNKIEAETPEEKELIQGGEERKVRRLQMMKKSLLKSVPSKEELNVIHNIFINTMDSSEFFLDKRILPPNSKWMSDATLSTVIFCHPEHRNLHNKIFGGFLIRQAIELSWITAFLYGMNIPRLVGISEIGFYSPVDVGALLKLNASVMYTEKEFLQIFVYAETFSSPNIEARNTTSFNFTYNLGKQCDSLYPLTYLEAMKYIEGRRHLYKYLNSTGKEFKNS